MSMHINIIVMTYVWYAYGQVYEERIAISSIWWIELHKHRVNTTISEKHWEILKKHTGKFETQQKVLESALQSFEENLR